MPIRVGCRGCGSVFKVKEKYAGRRRRCPKCGRTIHIPGDDEPTVVEDRPAEVPIKPLNDPLVPTHAALLEEMHAQGYCALVVHWKPGGAMEFRVAQTDSVTEDDRSFVILALAAEQDRSRFG